MKLHKLRLAWLRNRNNVLTLIASTAILTIVILQGILLASIYNQSERNEQVLKGLSCISLIKVENRTEENVQECIDKNTSTTADQTKFQSVSDSVVGSNTDTVTANISTQKLNIRIQEHNSKDSPQDNQTKSTPQQVTAPQEVILKETRIDPVSGKRQYRMAGDRIWADEQ